MTDVQLPDPDTLTFRQLWAIKAATGINPIECDASEQIAALYWYARQEAGRPIPWPEVQDMNPKRLIPLMDDLRDRVAAEQAAAEAIRSQRADAAALAEDLAALGEPAPVAAEPTTDPTSAGATSPATSRA
ncbi:hypothetical protein ACXJJ3_26705 [Kribbella sp. WER1]